MFVTVTESKAGCQSNVENIGPVFRSCQQCSAFWAAPMATKKSSRYTPSDVPCGSSCSVCGGRVTLGGPIWLGPLSDNATLQGISAEVSRRGDSLPSKTKLNGLLDVISRELDVPLFHHLPTLCKVMNMACPPMDVVRSAIVRAGHRVSISHCNAESIKSDISQQHLFDILKWFRADQTPPPNPPKPAESLLATKPTIDKIDTKTVIEEARVKKAKARFVKVSGWGPKKRTASGAAPKSGNHKKEKETAATD